VSFDHLKFFEIQDYVAGLDIYGFEIPRYRCGFVNFTIGFLQKGD
jgi:hypothetical protein